MKLITPFHLLLSRNDVGEQKHDAHEETDGADSDVCNAKEGVSATEQ